MHTNVCIHCRCDIARQKRRGKFTTKDTKCCLIKASIYIDLCVWKPTLLSKVEMLYLWRIGWVSGNDLELRPSVRNEVPMVVGVDESSKSPLINLNEDIED